MIDEALTYAADVFWKSGTIGLVTALLFFVCVGIAIERLLFWTRLWGVRLAPGGCARSAAHVGRIEELIRAGRFGEAGKEAGRSRHPALRVMGQAVSALREPSAWPSVRSHTLSEALGGGVTMGRRFLITSIQAFGLLGMLGTCKGLYTQLSGVGAVAADAGSIQTTMGGMGEAFTTTLVGLTAAALTTIIYLPNEIAIEGFQRQLRLFDARIQAALAECSAGQQERRKDKAA